MKIFIFTQNRYINVLREDKTLLMYNNSTDYIKKLRHVDYEAYKQIEPIINLDKFEIIGGANKETVWAYYRNNVQCGKIMFKAFLDMFKNTNFEELLNKQGFCLDTSILNTKELMNELLVKLREYEKSRLDIKEHIVNGNTCNYFIVPADDIINMLTDGNFRLSPKKTIFSDYPDCIASIQHIVAGDYICIDVDVASSNSFEETDRIFNEHKSKFFRAVDEYVRFVPLKGIAPKNFYKYATVKLLTYRTIRFIFELKTEYVGM